jgi:hypothetical protein
MEVALPTRSLTTGVTAWHYTTQSCLVSILHDRIIRPATRGGQPNERPVTWFSLSERWEETANTSRLRPDGTIKLCSRLETQVIGGGLCRIGVDAGSLCDWNSYANSGVDQNHVKDLLSKALAVGSDPERDWLVSFRPVPLEMTTAIGWQRGGEWISTA